MKNINQKLKNPLVHLCKQSGCNNQRYSLYYCKECLTSENERKKLLHKRKKDEGRCSDCGKDNNNNKWLCDECGIRNNIVSIKCISNKRSKQGYYGKIEQIMEII